MTTFKRTAELDTLKVQLDDLTVLLSVPEAEEINCALTVFVFVKLDFSLALKAKNQATISEYLYKQC